MYLIDRQDGISVRYDGISYEVLRDGQTIDRFPETRDRKVSIARNYATRYLRRNAKRLGIVAPPP